MTPPEPNDDDDLTRLLATWQISPPGDPQFRPAVWARLRKLSPATWAAYLRRHGVAWSVTVAFAMVTAGWAGRSVAQAKMESRREQMVMSYLGEIDPRALANQRR